MAVSIITICNSALYKVGSERISSLTENNKRARICNDQYERVRDEVLRAHPWNFSTKRVSLAALSSTPEFEYDYEYQLPADCLRVLNVENDYEHRIEGRKVLSNSTSISIKYIAKETDTSKYDPQFVEAVALRLAAELAFPIVQSLNLKNTLMNEYRLFLSDAKTSNAQEGTPEKNISDVWLDARINGLDTSDVGL